MSESAYKKAVMKAFDRKAVDGKLPSELLSPTPAGIKSLAVKTCERRFNNKDSAILISFVNNRDDMAAYRAAFQTGSADQFRPLVNFLNDRTIDTHFKNIQLLAWLIDFNPRPFHANLILPEDGEEPIEPGSYIPDGNKARRVKTKKQYPMVLLVAALIIIIGLTSYLFLKKQPEHYTGHEGCMIWNDDHYEPTECNDHSSGKTLYPIKHDLVDYFKKINDPKALAPDSKAWYGKYKGNVEFFTDSGPYPLDTNRRVLPVTPHIYDKYILHNTN